MANVIEEAKSGRASCRTCRKAIAKGELRFGVETQTQFSDTPSLQWHHLLCAAAKLPVELKAALADEAGRDYLIDVLALRRMVTEPVAPAEPRRPVLHNSRRWLTAVAALVVAGTAGGFVIGRQTGTVAGPILLPPAVTVQATPPELQIPAPSPTRVIHLQNGKDWTERAGGN